MDILPPLEPMYLNCWKHHLKFIQQQIQKHVDAGPDAVATLPEKLKVLGDSHLDLYTGPTQPQVIAAELLGQLGDLDVARIEHFQAWVAVEETNYRILHMSDLSFWRLQKSDDLNQYIEFMPGCNSYLTIRVQADALRRAILTMAISKLEDRDANLELINEVSVKYLGLNPIKSLLPGCNLNRILALMNRKPIRVTVVS